MTTASNRWLAVILAVITPWIWYGCSRPTKDIKSDEFFTKWLQGHGESNIVVDAYGVGLTGNPTRLRWSLYGSQRPTNGIFNAELEFRVRVPDQREIVEYVAGTGSSQQQAEDDAKLNFVVSTFHEVNLIGAHYDSVPMCPGADNNGSAVAAMLGCAAACSLCCRSTSLRSIMKRTDCEEAAISWSRICRKRHLVSAAHGYTRYLELPVPAASDPTAHGVCDSAGGRGFGE